MSGHSHFSSIKHKKEANDAQRGRVFSKMAREIAIAARSGLNLETNAKLRVILEKAKSFNMPHENIERALKKASGEEGGVVLEEVLFEAYGPGGIAILIEGITDNNKRTVSEIKQALIQHGGKFVESGSVKWLFGRKGVIVVPLAENSGLSREDLELKAIDAGAEDVYWHTDSLDVYSQPENLDKIKKNLESLGIKIESASMGWVPKEDVAIEEKDKETCQRLFESLDENEAVTEIYSNLTG